MWKKKTLNEYDIIENKYLIMKKKTKKIIAFVNQAVLIILQNKFQWKKEVY